MADVRFSLGAACGLAAAFAASAAARALRRRSGTITRGRAVRHCVQIAFTPNSPVDDILNAFDEMCMRMPDLVLAYERGTQCSPEPHTKNLTHIFLLTFPSPAARDAYLPHPIHEAFGKRWIAPYLEELCVSDYEIDHEMEVECDGPWWQPWSW